MRSLLILFAVATLAAQTGFPKIDALIRAGEFTKAQSAILSKINSPKVSAQQVSDLKLQSAILDRIRIDFNRDIKYVKQTLAKYYPNLTDAQIKKWEATNDLEWKIIDGEKWYFRNAVWNLFRVDPDAKKRREEVDGPRASKLNDFLASYHSDIVNTLTTSGKQWTKPERIRITYTLTVKPDMVPKGEMIRVWLPYPRTDLKRLHSVKLLNTSEANYIIAPDSYAHTSLYMEKPSNGDQPTVFSFRAEYTAENEWVDLANAAIRPYDKNSDLYQTYTAERAPHIQFTDKIRSLSKKIVGSETDPLKKARLIYDWIGDHIPWASALEYSTIPNLSQYCAENGSGDCGIKSLLFITLCRLNGIPAKWQSGWFLYPVSTNLHDWSEVYFEGVGWVPMDSDFNTTKQITDSDNAADFFFGGADAFRLIVNDDWGRSFFPAKIHERSETVDFQRGEVEWRGGNLYFNTWRYNMKVEHLDD